MLCFKTGSITKPTCVRKQWSLGIQVPFLEFLSHFDALASQPGLKRLGPGLMQTQVLEAHGCSVLGPAWCFSRPNCSRQTASELCRLYLLWIEALSAPLSQSREESRLSGWRQSWTLASGHTVQSRCLFRCNNQPVRAQHLVLPARPLLGSWRAASLPGGRASMTSS